eukprot:scaffold6592_cov30-Tisochrysis_lutea.AAC.4
MLAATAAWTLKLWYFCGCIGIWKLARGGTRCSGLGSCAEMWGSPSTSRNTSALPCAGNRSVPARIPSSDCCSAALTKAA